MATQSDVDHIPRKQNRWGEGDRLRDEILKAARRILEADGTEASMTLRGVAREAGITAPSIYSHFKDRESLLEAVIEAIYADYLNCLEKAQAELPAAASPRDRLRAGAAAFIDFAHASPASAQVLWARPHPTALPTVSAAGLGEHKQLLAVIAAAAPALTVDQVRLRGQLLWGALYGLAILPPHQPRFPWATQQELIDDLLNSLLAT